MFSFYLKKVYNLNLELKEPYILRSELRNQEGLKLYNCEITMQAFQNRDPWTNTRASEGVKV